MRCPSRQGAWASLGNQQWPEASWDEAEFARVTALLGTAVRSDEKLTVDHGYIGDRWTGALHDRKRVRQSCLLSEIRESWPIKDREPALREGVIDSV